MPRSNRPRRRPAHGVGSAGGAGAEAPEGDLSRILFRGQRTEGRRGREFVIQNVSGASSVKSYVCPGCMLSIAPGTPHVVVWRADGLFGEEADLAGRRHWHTHCWRIA